MHRRYCALLIPLGLLPAPAAKADSAFYFTASAGAFLAQDVIRPSTFSNSRGQTVPGTSTTDNGLGVSLNHGIGYRLGNGFRIEGELGYTHFGTAGATPAIAASGLAGSPGLARLNGSHLTTISGGARDIFTATVNGFYDLPVAGRFVPYLGMGLGIYRAEAEETRFADASGTQVLRGRSGHSANAMVLGEVGVTVALNADWAIAPAYRYEHLFVRGGGDVDGHVLRLAVRYNF